jgi:diguanylate cyclase (GGDEF)-like protein
MIKILVIEDEELMRANNVQILEFENFDAISAKNGLIGVQLAQEQLPDLILCDVMMPGLDGYGVLRALRQNPATAAIPFIFTTAKASKADFRQGMELGADDYLTKPFTSDELVAAIATRLKKRAAIAQRYTTKLKQAEEKLNYSVYYDSLTNLPNQLLLRKRLNQLLIQGNYNERLLTILTLSLEQFNQINSTLGHPFGDLLLKAVAERLIASVGENDTVARLQADRFAIILATLDQKQEAANVAQTILDVLSQPFILDGHEVFITVNIGIALHPFDGSDIDTLLKNADIAMYIAKKQEGTNYQFYSRDMNVEFSNQLALKTSLHHGLERAEFQVYYQPQVDLQTRQIVGAEALLRWQHPEWGLVSPAKFIPLAEEIGLIIPIGDWVLRTACRQTKLWQAAGFPHLRIAVNISGRQFSQQDFSKRLVQILKETGLDPKYLELELTETIVIKDPEAAIITLNELKALGIQISIDDFGTGYSSLSYLKKFPFDTLKIDQGFVRDITNDAKNAEITTAIIQMARGLNLKVIAEGVETEAELSFLYQQQCDEIQGYLFSRPVSAKEFERLLIPFCFNYATNLQIVEKRLHSTCKQLGRDVEIYVNPLGCLPLQEQCTSPIPSPSSLAQFLAETGLTQS